MNITLYIEECCYNNNNGFQKVTQKCYTFTELSQSIPIINCYSLSILSYNQNQIIISIQNNNETYIRILHLSYPLELCFSQNNITHHIVISVA